MLKEEAPPGLMDTDTQCSGSILKREADGAAVQQGRQKYPEEGGKWELEGAPVRGQE